MKKATETMKFKISTKLLDSASFIFVDTDITYFVSNQNNEDSRINFTAERDGNVFQDEYFNTTDSLMLFLENENIDIENFQEYDYENDEILIEKFYLTHFSGGDFEHSGTRIEFESIKDAQEKANWMIENDVIEKDDIENWTIESTINKDVSITIN